MSAEVLYSEEKKDDPPMPTSAAATTENGGGKPLSASKQRAKQAGSNGLSELSKQLRIYMAKNEAQAIEINRLERQLRILAELQGISVADLRKALEDACANEAFGEMQHRVAKLRAELEAATLTRQKELRRDAAAPQIANLELRVGELEEVEEKHQAEVAHLYDQLRHEREKANRLESTNDQHKKDANDYLERLKKEQARAARLEATYQEQLQKMLDEQAKKMQQLASEQQKLMAQQKEQQKKEKKESKKRSGKDADGSSVASISPEMAKEYERMVKALREKDDALRKAQAELEAEREKWAKKVRDSDAQAREAENRRKNDKDQMDLTVKELRDADSQNELRLAQFKARFGVQDQNIKDMGQQLDSLYAAFMLMKEEQDAEDMKRAALRSNLDDADAQVARQVDDQEKNKSSRRGGGQQRGRGVEKYDAGQNGYGDFADALGSSALGSSARGSYVGAGDRSSALSGRDGGSGQYLAIENGSYGAGSGVARGGDGYGGDAYALKLAAYSPEKKTPDGVPRVITAPGSITSRGSGTDGLSPPPVAYGTPMGNGSRGRGGENSPRTPTTWQLLFPEKHYTSGSIAEQSNHSGHLISGVLICKSNSKIRKWKSKWCRLHLIGDHYQMDVGENKSFPLELGISKVEFYPNHPLSFILHTNPFDDEAPVVVAAAMNEADYNRWMMALRKATSGEEYEPATPQPANSSMTSGSAGGAGRRSSSIRRSTASATTAPHSHREQSDAELERALVLSKESADLERALALSKDIV